MEIKSKLYPYPVLSKFSDDYLDSEFRTEADIRLDGYDVSIGFEAIIKNEEIESLLESSQAAILYHLECPQTGYRTILETGENEKVARISSKDVSGRLQVCSFIVAKEKIIGYTNKDFNQDYRGFRFDIDAGSVLAVGEQVNADIEQDPRSLADVPSLLSVIRNADENARGIVVDMNANRILAKLPEADFLNYKMLRNEQRVQPVLNSLIVLPSLLFVFGEIARLDQEERYDYTGYAWYRSLKKILLERFACDIEKESFAERNLLELSQSVIDIPIENSLEILFGGYGVFDEEDDDE